MKILEKTEFIIISVVTAVMIDILFYILNIKAFIGVSAVTSGVITLVLSKIIGSRIDIYQRNIIFLIIAFLVLFLTGIAS